MPCSSASRSLRLRIPVPRFWNCAGFLRPPRPSAMRRDVKVKVCGITNAEDALAAVEAGADAFGFIFFETSPRYVVPSVAASIIAELPPLVTPVGVFVNEGMAAVRSIMDTCGLAMAQLHV